MDLGYFLRVHRDFATFPDDERAALERMLTARQYPRGHVFMREGERGEAMYLILDGQVLVTRGRQADGAPRIICALGPGELFGLIALIDRGPRSATCSAMSEVQAAALPAETFAALFAADAPLAHRFQALIARQLASDLRLYNAALTDLLLAAPAAERGEAALSEHRLPRDRGTPATDSPHSP